MRKLYNWALRFAGHPHALKIMLFVTFLEASVFMIPPYPLQIAISIQNTRRALWIAAFNTTASVLGGFLGYLIGYMFWEVSHDFFFQYIFSPQTYDKVTDIYKQNAVGALILGSIMPIPFKALAIIGGASHVPLGTFFIGSVIGRSMRFFAVGILFFIFGEPVKVYIDKYLERIVLTVGSVVLLFVSIYLYWRYA